ncbi:TlpA family protein disulfide reductase [Chryseobacterium lactis]|uniref:TlpA family protein disulfide reductase n=1 Tax=Chryseobacterium lactis TaxID=1241981 RepID=A0A3G6RK29_CHRLC|nr:TlpA disulfide reductase family protein [Chryseobacterium lactis]AZA83174.1 TlpA family protein disulfide reductase [Chryseobacterium lactis]AZB03559.1 TlpA family protein disulfide reductase [Chryseobacterium lactis]PNW11935.1 TlpA family protein disulfide reductase [Chryseobacterium lactis]
MENLKKWIRSNWSTLILVIVFIILLVSPDAKAWLMRQVASTGFLNSSISEPKTKEKNTESASSYNFTLQNEEGKMISLSELKGRVVFINFWASWCPPCRAEFPSVQRFYEKYRSKPEIIFLTVNLDDNPVSGKKYLTEKGFTLPFLIPAGSIPKEIYDGTLPTTVVLDKQGEIRLHHKGLADYSKESFYKQIDQLLNQ